jgi:hypothetical protein
VEIPPEDLQIMGGRRWRKQCEERAQWKKITEKAKTQWVVMPIKEEEEVKSIYLCTTCYGPSFRPLSGSNTST